MKLTTSQIESLVRRVVIGLEKNKLITMSQGRDKALFKGKEILLADYKKEAELDVEIERMMDAMEKDNDQFQRHRMFGMLKKKVAAERGIVL